MTPQRVLGCPERSPTPPSDGPKGTLAPQAAPRAWGSPALATVRGVPHTFLRTEEVSFGSRDAFYVLICDMSEERELG